MPMLKPLPRCPQTGTPFLIVGVIILAVQFLCSEMTCINVFCLVSLPRARSVKTNEAGQLARPHEFSWTVFRTAGHKFRFRDLVVVVSVHFCPPTGHLVLRIFIFEILELGFELQHPHAVLVLRLPLANLPPLALLQSSPCSDVYSVDTGGMLHIAGFAPIWLP